MTLAPLGLMARVPAWAWVMMALAAWGGWHRWQAIDARRSFEQAQATAQAERAESERAAAVETSRRIQRQAEVTHAAQRQAQALRADADAARAALERLRAQLATAAAPGAAADPAVAAGSPPAPGAPGVLAQLLGQCGERVRSLAAHADAAAAAGSACEASYDALSAKP